MSKSVGNRLVANVCTSAPFTRRDKYLQVTKVCQLYELWERGFVKSEVITTVNIRGSSVSIATTLRAKCSKNRGSISGRGNKFTSPQKVQIGAGAHADSYSVVIRRPFPRGKAAGA